MQDVKNTLLAAMKNIEKRLEALGREQSVLKDQLEHNDAEIKTLLQVMKQHEDALKLLEGGKSPGKVKKQK